MRIPLRCPTLAAIACICSTLSAQTADPVARVFHPTPPLPSYDVATIKPSDPAGGVGPNGFRLVRGSTIRE